MTAGPATTVSIQLATGRVDWLLSSSSFSQLVSSADGKYLIAPVDGSLRFFDLQTGAVSVVTLGARSVQVMVRDPWLLKVHALLSDGTVSSITPLGVKSLFLGCSDGPAISSDGRRLVAVCSGDIVVLDALSGGLIQRITPNTAVDHPVINSDGSRVVVREHVVGGPVSSDLAVWRVATGTRGQQGVTPRLQSGDDVQAILATTGAGDALLVTTGSRGLGSCPAANYRAVVVDSDTWSSDKPWPSLVNWVLSGRSRRTAGSSFSDRFTLPHPTVAGRASKTLRQSQRGCGRRHGFELLRGRVDGPRAGEPSSATGRSLCPGCLVVD